jgi:hypothetical protein
MSNNVDLIVSAIKSLQYESNIFKDYVFPILSIAFTPIIGAGAAYWAIRHQDMIQIEKNKIDTSNSWILKIDSVRSTLIAIKQNYHGKLTDNPIQRALKIPTIIQNVHTLSGDLSGLSFIIQKSNNLKNEKWSQISRISAMIENYNNLMIIWEKRNQFERPLKEKLLKDVSTHAYAETNKEQVIQSIGLPDLVSLVDLTERATKITDDLIIETNDFLLQFPDLANSNIKVKKLKSYGSVWNTQNSDSPEFLELLKRSPTVDINRLSKLYNQSPEEIISRYKTGYEQ